MAVDLGFSSKLEQTERLISRDGSINVRRISRNPFLRLNVYHSLLEMPISHFLLLVFSFYAVTNALFALLYLAIGIEHLSNPPVGFAAQFQHAYFFSVQTLTTTGYGAVHPIGLGANILASLEAMIGLMAFALGTGLLYGRFARPRAKILFSENAFISPYREGMNGLMFRIVNTRKNPLINLNARLTLVYFDVKKGEKTRKFIQLPLEFSEVSMLALSWTVVHPIDDESPLKGKTIEDLREMRAELLVMLRAYDDMFSQEVHTRASYTTHEIAAGRKFLPMFHVLPDGSTALELDKISDAIDAPITDTF